jgi:hypothetical protein
LFQLLGLCIEQQMGSRARQVRTAEAVLTVLYGASQLSAAAPGDGVVTVLGLGRLAAAEEAVRAAPAGVPVTVVVVTGDPGELAPLARLAIAGLTGLLRRAFPVAAWPGVQVVLDEAGAVAAAACVPAVSDVTESAVLMRGGRIVARAEGPGAGHAAATSL